MPSPPTSRPLRPREPPLRPRGRRVPPAVSKLSPLSQFTRATFEMGLNFAWDRQGRKHPGARCPFARTTILLHDGPQPGGTTLLAVYAALLSEPLLGLSSGGVALLKYPAVVFAISCIVYFDPALSHSPSLLRVSRFSPPPCSPREVALPSPF